MPLHYQKKSDKFDYANDIIDVLKIPEKEYPKMFNQLIKMNRQQLGWLHHYIVEAIKKDK